MKKLLLVSICSAVLLCVAGQVHCVEAAPAISTGMRKLEQFLSPHNEALDKALVVHNLMTELPGLKVIVAQQVKVKTVANSIKKFQSDLMKCNEQRFGRFKNAKEVLAKVRDTYGERVKKLESEKADGTLLTAVGQHSKLYLRKKKIEEELVSEALTNGSKWGGQSVDKQPRPLPEHLGQVIHGTGLEELAQAERGLHNAETAVADYNSALLKMQQAFVERLSSVGLSFPDFDATKPKDIRQVQDALKDLKNQYLDKAEAYIVKLDEQDAAYPEAVARRESRSKNKRVVLKQIQEAFPDEFAEMHRFDQRTPQDRQRMLITAMKKDKEGTVFLTETNALEIDQLMAERKSTENLLDSVQAKSDAAIKEIQQKQLDPSDFDFSQCSG